MNKNKYLHVISGRRKLLLASAAWPAMAWAGALRAQAKPPVLIGWLHPATREAGMYTLDAFNEGMAALGWKAGTQYVVDEHWANGRLERVPVLAQEIAARKPAVIVVSGAVGDMAKAAPTTPIVMGSSSPPLGELVKSLARPGGMITGMSNVNAEMDVKLIELLVQSLPNLRRVGLFVSKARTNYSRAEQEALRAVAHFRVEAVIADIAKPEDIEPAIARLAKTKTQGLVLLGSAWFATYRQEIMKLALAQRIPVVGANTVFAEAGALFSYGPDRAALNRRAAYFVDRILKGTKPADLPIELPTKFEMILNLKTAKMLGITIPQTILVRANKVIE